MQRVLLCLLVLLVATPAVASDFWDEVRTPGLATYRDLLDRARLALQASQTADAERFANEAAALVTDATEPLVLRGLARGRRGAVASGAEDLRAALARNARAIDLRWTDMASEILLKAGSLEEAAAVLGRAVRIEGPGRARDHRFERYGHIQLALGRAQEAIDAYRESMRALGGSPHAWLGLSLALRRAGEREADARQLAERAGNAMGRPLLLAHDLPPAEIAAREALLMEAAGDTLGARSAWDRAREGVWRAHAESESTRLAQ